MNKPFIIKEDNKHQYVVSWPTFQDIRAVSSKHKLCDVLFSELNNFDVGITFQREEEVYTMYLNYTTYMYYSTPTLNEYLDSQYRIVGVVFTDEQSAQKLVDWLEKKYIWQLLQE